MLPPASRFTSSVIRGLVVASTISAPGLCLESSSAIGKLCAIWCSWS